MHILDKIEGSGLFSPTTFPGALLYAGLFAVVAWLLGNLLRLTVERILARDTHDHFDRMGVKFFAKLLRYCVYGFAVFAYVHFVPSLASLGPASLTSLSVITVIIGLAAQNTLGNLVAGISLLLYRPFKLGDRLQVLAPTGVETGVVENLTLGYTLLKTDENRRVVVPNSLMASQTTINLTGSDPRILCTVSISVSYGSDLERVRGILLQLARQHPQALEPCLCPLIQLGPAGMVFGLEAWCANALTAITLRCDLLELAVVQLAAAGIALSPQPMLLILPATPPPAGPGFAGNHGGAAGPVSRIVHDPAGPSPTLPVPAVSGPSSRQPAGFPARPASASLPVP